MRQFFLKCKANLKKNNPKLFETIKRIHKISLPLRYHFEFGYYGYDRIGICLGGIIRKHFPDFPSRYSHLKKIKGIHRGKRCFIVATGPSLRIEDLDMLKNEWTISMNSIVACLDKTTWRPSYYIVQDSEAMKEMLDSNANIQDVSKNVFISQIVRRKCYLSFDAQMLPLDMCGHNTRHQLTGIKFSENCYEKIYDGYTVTYSAIQLAAYMGFKEIYLLGCDCNYNLKNKHAFGYHFSEEREEGLSDESDIMALRMISAYCAAKEYADKHDLKIFNATRGGKLEVFQRINFESLFI